MNPSWIAVSVCSVLAPALLVGLPHSLMAKGEAPRVLFVSGQMSSIAPPVAGVQGRESRPVEDQQAKSAPERPNGTAEPGSGAARSTASPNTETLVGQSDAPTAADEGITADPSQGEAPKPPSLRPDGSAEPGSGSGAQGPTISAEGAKPEHTVGQSDAPTAGDEGTSADPSDGEAKMSPSERPNPRAEPGSGVQGPTISAEGAKPEDRVGQSDAPIAGDEGTTDDPSQRKAEKSPPERPDGLAEPEEAGRGHTSAGKTAKP